MKKKIIPTPIKKLQALAALAPKDDQSPTPSSKKEKKSQRRGSQAGPDWGIWQVDKYLDHYGIVYNLKMAGSRKIYKLKQCLFDPSHSQNESAIVQDASGLITYQCFHDSCNYKWKDARQKISGEAKHPEFFTKYDPNYKPKDREAGTGILKDLNVEPTSAFTAGTPGVPLPRDIDPMEFYIKSKSTGKFLFVPVRMAKYYVNYFKNLHHTAGAFWIFKDGLWQEISEFVLNQVCVQAMKENVHPNMIDGSIKVLRGLVNREPKEWPDIAGYINCINGMIDIHNGMKLIPHDPLLGSRTQVPCDFDIKHLDNCERWYQFLDEIFPDEPDKIDLLQQFFGYCLMTDCRFEKMLFMIGSGGNGKGTVLTMLNEIVGSENTSSLTMRDLSDPKFSLYFLQNKLVNVSTETSHRDPVATEHLKTIVSGEWLTAERKHGHKFQFKPYVKMILSMQETPVIPDRSYGLERRLLILRFNQRFTDETKDPDLKQKLLPERDGVFTWALLGLEKLLKNNGFSESGAVQNDKQAFMMSLHPLLQFVDEKCVLGRTLEIEVNDLHRIYCKWCEEGQYRKLARNRFTEQILMNFPNIERKPLTKTRRIHFVGIGAVSEFESNEE